MCCRSNWPESKVYSVKTSVRDESDSFFQSSGTKVSNESKFRD
jgi:hypothetical protein